MNVQCPECEAYCEVDAQPGSLFFLCCEACDKDTVILLPPATRTGRGIAYWAILTAAIGLSIVTLSVSALNPVLYVLSFFGTGFTFVVLVMALLPAQRNHYPDRWRQRLMPFGGFLFAFIVSAIAANHSSPNTPVNRAESQLQQPTETSKRDEPIVSQTAPDDTAWIKPATPKPSPKLSAAELRIARKAFKDYWDTSIAYMVSANMGLNLANEFAKSGSMKDAYNMFGSTGQMTTQGQLAIAYGEGKWDDVASALGQVMKDKERMRYLAMKLFEGDDTIDRDAVLPEVDSMDAREEALMNSAHVAAKEHYRSLGGRSSEILSYDAYSKLHVKKLTDQFFSQR